MSDLHAQPRLAARAAPDAASRLAKWRALGAIGLVLLTFAAFWPSTLSLMASWEDGEQRTYTHGYVVLLLALWLIWRVRWDLAAIEARPFLPALGLAVVGALSWLMAFRAGLQIVHQAALPALAAVALLIAYGWPVLRRLAFPLAWLYLAIPVWDALLPVLNWISVMAVRLLVRIADVPAYFANNTFEIPLGTFEIADGCSGLHFFVVALTISLLYGEVNRDTLRTRVKLVVFALLLAMATNWLRIFIIVLAGYLSDMQHRLVTDEHYSFGWYMFAGMMVVYFFVVRRWPAGSHVPASGNPPDVAVPITRRGLAAALLGLALAPLALALDANQADASQLDRLMRTAAGAAVPGAAPALWRPGFPGADREFHGAIGDGPARVEVYAAGFAAQRQGKELSGFLTSVTGEMRRARSAGVAPAPWSELAAVDNAGGHWLVWYSYRMNERRYRDALRVQLDYGLGSFFGNPAAAVIALRARCEMADCAGARVALTRVSESNYP